MNKKQLLDHLQNDVYCRIGISKIHGVGVIAIRDIPEGTNPFVGSSESDYIPFTKQELINIDSEVMKMIDDFFITRGNEVLIPMHGLNGIDLSYFMNHSDTPNIRADHQGNNFIAIKNITKGEELTINYSKDYGEENIRILQSKS